MNKPLREYNDADHIEINARMIEASISFLIEAVNDFDPESLKRFDFTSIEIEIPDNANGDLLEQVNATLKQYPGDAPIAILIPKGDTFKKMNLNITVSPDLALVDNIEKLLGPNSVRII